MEEQVYLTTDRIVIRNSIFDDCVYFDKWENKDYIKEFLSIDESRDYEDIVRELILSEQDKTVLYLTIVLKEEQRPIGRIYLSRLDKKYQSIDITRIYIGEEEYLGKGLGKESMILILKYCFEELNMERVTLDTFDGNENASNLYKNLGFIDEGTMRNATKRNGKFYNLNLKSILSCEYENNYRK